MIRSGSHSVGQTGRTGRTRPVGARRRSRAGYLFVGGYVVLLVLVGIAPAGYALELAFTSVGGRFTALRTSSTPTMTFVSSRRLSTSRSSWRYG